MTSLASLMGGGVKSVQRADTTVGASTTGTATVASVNTAKSVLILCGSTVSGSVGSVRGTLTNATTITFTNPLGSSSIVSWQLIEFY